MMVGLPRTKGDSSNAGESSQARSQTSRMKLTLAERCAGESTSASVLKKVAGVGVGGGVDDCGAEGQRERKSGRTEARLSLLLLLLLPR